MSRKVSPDSTITIEAALQRASLCLREAGIEQPRDEAEILLAHLQGWNRLKLFLERSNFLDSDLVSAFRAAVERRARDEPSAYITGTKEFYGLSFAVNREVLIPRPETELLVDIVLEWARTQKGELRGVDLGCGSGNLAITLAYHLPEASFYAVDLSTGALQLAETNALRHGVRERVHFFQGDYLDAFSGTQPPPVFNLVVSNPPYLRSSELENLPVTIRDYEPPLSLNGGPDGLVAYRSILALLPRFLQAPGLMALEIGFTQGEALLSLCRKQALFHTLSLRHDYQNLPRVLIGLF